MVRITDIKNTIVTALRTVDGIQEVFGHPTDGTNTGYPLCEVSYAGHDEEFFTNRSNEVAYRYDIYLFDDLQRENKTKAEVEAGIEEIGEAALDKLRTLDLSAHSGAYLTIPRSSGMAFFKRGTGNVRGYKISLSVKLTFTR